MERMSVMVNGKMRIANMDTIIESKQHQRFEVKTWLHDQVLKDSFIDWFISVRGAPQEWLKEMNMELAGYHQEAVKRKLLSTGMLIVVNKKYVRK